jgi:hypothetical protein
MQTLSPEKKIPSTLQHPAAGRLELLATGALTGLSAALLTNLLQAVQKTHVGRIWH